MKKITQLFCKLGAIALFSFGFMTNSALADPYRVALNVPYPPFEFRNKNGEIEGFDFDLIKEIAKTANLEFVYETTSNFDVLLNGIKEGKYDVAISAITITEARRADMLFSDPYLETYSAAFFRDIDENKNITSFLGLADKKVSAIASNHELELLKTYVDEPNIITEPTQFLTLKDLLTNKSDAALGNVHVMRYLSKPYESKGKLRYVSLGHFKEHYGIAIAKKNENLLKPINEALAKLKSNGQYQAIYDAWLK